MAPRLRDCGNPACHICRWNREGEPIDSGHPESLASLLLGAAFLVLLFAFVLFLLPVLVL